MTKKGVIIVWKPLDFIDCKRYEVHPSGLIRNSVTGRILKPSHDRDGYCLVNLYTESSGYKKVKSFRVHVLVAKAFLSNPDNSRTVNHKDTNKDNNCVDNLEWATDKQNVGHGHITGAYSQRISKDKYYCVQEAIRMGKTYASIREEFGVSVNTISKMKKNPVSWEEYYGQECND